MPCSTQQADSQGSNVAHAMGCSSAVPLRRSKSWSKPIPDSCLGQQVSRHGRIVFDLLAQIGHVHPYVVGVLCMAGSPDGLEQLLVRDDPIRLCRQVREQAVFDRRQVQRLAVAFHHACPSRSSIDPVGHVPTVADMAIFEIVAHQLPLDPCPRPPALTQGSVAPPP